MTSRSCQYYTQPLSPAFSHCTTQTAIR